MRERRFPVGVLIIIPVIIGFGVYAFTGNRPLAPVATPTATATAHSLFPSPTPDGWPLTPVSPPASLDPTPVSPPFEMAPGYAQPVLSHGPFHEGAWVRVNAGAGDCLNARMSPSLDEQYALVNSCLPDGFEGYVFGTAQEGDGHWWWQLAGAGFVAEDYLVYVREASVREEMAPQFAGRGQIAFVRDGGLWLMEASGAGQRPLVAPATGDVGVPQPQDVSWSPDGTRLSYNLPRWGTGADNLGTVELHVVDVAGNELLMVPDVAGRGWSPDGTRIGIVQGAQPQQMGGGWNGTPGWVDVPSGDVHRVGSETFWQQDPPAFNYDGSLLLVTRTWEVTNAEGFVNSQTGFIVHDLDGNEVRRELAPKDSWYGSPLWSPVANQISLHVSEANTPHYAVYDVDAGAIVAEAAVPEANPNRGGGCGGTDMWRSAWSRDGRSVYYSYYMGIAGTNGVWSWDVASGSQSIMRVTYSSAPSPGPDTLVAFSADRYIMVGDAATGSAVIITDGWFPVWSPVP